MQTLQSILCKIANILDRENIPYMVIGGQAVMIYGEPRMTKDIDITLDRDIDSLPLIKKLADELELKPLIKDVDQFVQRNNVLPVSDSKGMVRVDFIFSFMPYEHEAIRRANKIDITGTRVSYACIEDVIIHKIVAGRPRDIEDVKGILNRNTVIDKKLVVQCLDAFSGTVGHDLTAIFKEINKN
ncbi:MAG: nucleotidyl transferase AbiEii/AbiGii toxin family protein [Bacteroidota bacterium]